MKIPFDIKYKPQIESGKYKVVTEDNEPARIICWDSTINKERPIIAIVFDDQIEQYKADGRYDDDYDRSNYDLFIITPEPELSDLEIHLLDWLSSDTCGEIPMEKMKKCVKNRASELLELARKEIMKEWGNGLNDTQDRSGKAYNDGYKLGLLQGKAKALKELPRWRKWENGACGNGQGIPIAIVKRWPNGYELVDALGVQGEQYIMLSDLEKLPGFNE